MKNKIVIKLRNISLVTHNLSKYIKDLSPGDLVSFIEENNKDKFWNCIYFPKGTIKYDINHQYQYFHKYCDKYMFLHHNTELYDDLKYYFYYGYKLKELPNAEQKKKIEISLFL